MIDYTKYTDEELVALIRQKQTEGVSEADGYMTYLLRKYGPLVRKETHELFLIGAEQDDLVQEGMIGLYQAIRGYDSTKQVPFFSFAETCIRRQVFTAITQSQRKKNIPLNTFVSIFEEQGENGTTIEEMLEAADGENPENLIIQQEFLKGFFKKLEEKLSKTEKQVLPLFLEGMVYSEIALKLGKEPKSIDNAIQRIRKKISELKAGE